MLDALVEAAANDFSVQQIEFRARRKDGSLFWAELDMAPLYYEDRARGNIVCSIRDISARKHAEETLQTTKNHLQAILDYSPLAITVKDLDGRYVMANTYAAEQIGFTHEQILGKTSAELEPTNSGTPVTVGTDLQVIERDAPVEVELTTSRDGEERTFTYTKFPLRNSNGRTFAIGAIGVDITQRKRMEAELMRETQLLVTLIDTIPDLIYVKDRESRFTLMNMSHARHFKTMPHQAIGETDEAFYPP
jgi:PAS domain S-box-containing protein